MPETATKGLYGDAHREQVRKEDERNEAALGARLDEARLRSEAAWLAMRDKEEMKTWPVAVCRGTP